MALGKIEESMMRDATKHAVTLRQNGKLTIFHDFDLAIKLMDLHRVMEGVLSSRVELFGWRERPKTKPSHPSWGDGRIVPKLFGKDLLKYMHMNIDGYRDEFPGHDFHPLINHFGKYAPQMDLHAHTPTKDACDRLNWLVEDMRAQARTKAFRRKRDARLRYSRDATKRLQAHVDKFFHRCSRALVVRINLSYHIDKTQFLASSNKQRSSLVSEQQARTHRNAFIRYLKRQFRVKLHTYAWKEELGRFTSYHYHMLLFFDGNISRSGFTIGNEVGMYWENVITGGKGRFHNCAYDKHVTQGIGLINYWDIERIKALKEIVIPYLTKSDYFIRLVSRGRIFGKGGLPPKPKNRCGRPRKYRPLSPPGISYQPSHARTSVPASPVHRKPDVPGSAAFRL
jgi:hypothetical protein